MSAAPVRITANNVHPPELWGEFNDVRGVLSCRSEARETLGNETPRWNKPTPHNWRSFHPEGENHEDASCCCHSCDGDRSPRSGEGGEGEAGAIGAPARLSVIGATRLLQRLPSE